MLETNAATVGAAGVMAIADGAEPPAGPNPGQPNPMAAVIADARGYVQRQDEAAARRRAVAAFSRQRELMDQLSSLQAQVNAISTEYAALSAAIKKAEAGDPSDLPEDPGAGNAAAGRSMTASEYLDRLQRAGMCGCPSCRLGRQLAGVSGGRVLTIGG